MKRHASTSSVGGHEEAGRKILLEEYMFQRRVLFGCSVLMVLSLLVWIIAIATDHWIIISGGAGIFIPETRRFFMSSHSGLWRHCRYTITPTAQPTANVIRNFTSIAYQNPTFINDAKMNLSRLDFIQEFRDIPIQFPLSNFTEDAKKRMFAHWVRGEDEEFQSFAKAYRDLTSYASKSEVTNYTTVYINQLDVSGVEAANTFGDALQKLNVNGSLYYFVIPDKVNKAIFEGWNEKKYVPKLIWPFVRDAGISPFVLRGNSTILQLVPPTPPPKSRKANGFDYNWNRRCQYIDMFPNSKMLMTDPGYDEDLMEYIRAQASFACITLFVMCLGAVFSFYTFMNPRYMFKRLAGGIHLVAASCAFVVIQVMLGSIEYTREHLFYAYPVGAELKYGYGVYFAWFTFGVNILCGVMFIWYSGKKKGSKAATDELAMADEPTIMGR